MPAAGCTRAFAGRFPEQHGGAAGPEGGLGGWEQSGFVQTRW
jgi:hypothetical protein